MDFRSRDEIIQHYFLLGLSHSEILYSIAKNHNIVFSERHLRRVLQKLKLFRKKHFSSLSGVAAFIHHQLDGSGQMHGYRWMHQKLIQNGFTVTHETVRLMLQILDPIGVNIRQKKRLRRRKYFCVGPNFLWHIDGYDKLKPYGLCIHGCIDGFSRKILWLKVFSTNNDPSVIAGYFIEYVSEIKGCSKIVRADNGTETVSINQMQIFLRSNEDENNDNICFIYGKSTGNQRIESFWSILRKQNVQFWMNTLLHLSDVGLFTGSFLDKELIRFCFMNIVQNELDEVVHIWNSHRIRPVKNSICLSGRPNVLYSFPEIYNTRDYLCEIDDDKLDVCKTECKFRNYPCDKDVFELLILLMEENNYFIPTTADQATFLYINLRSDIMEVL